MRLILAFAILWASTAAAEEKPVEIPLDQIWSNAAPSSRSLRSLEPELLINRDTPEKIKKYSSPEALADLRKKAEQSLVLKIERAMNDKAGNKKPPAGFAVRGTGRDALRGVYATLVENEKPKNQFSLSDGVSIVFLSLPAGASVSIDRVERAGNVVRVYYFVASEPRAYINWRLAIISLGKLEAGSYRVEMVRSPIEQHPSPRVQAYIRNDSTRVDPKLDSSIICQPFSFEVSGR
jgi:hypothetical protein